MKKLFTYPFLLLLIISCNTSPNERAHPDFEQLPSSQEIDYTLDLENLGSPSMSMIFQPDSLSVWSTIESGASGIDLFDIKEIKMDSRGTIYITKTGSKSIFVYDKYGAFKYKIGREGKGPGEFLQLITFDFNKSHEKLYVLDRSEVEVFTLVENKYQYQDTIYHGLLMSRDLCVQGNNIYLSGFKYEESDTLADKGKPFSFMHLTSGPINKYSIDANKIVSSFGPDYNSYSGWALTDAMLSTLMLTCNESSNTIVGLFKNFAYFFGYKPSGKLKWISKINNFKYPAITETNLNSARPGYKAGPGYIFLPFRGTDSRFALLQIKNTPFETPTVILDTKTGKLFYGGSLSSMFMTKTGSIIITILEDKDSKYGSLLVRVKGTN